MSKPKILVVDIETCPGESYFWNTRDQYIPLDRIKRPGHIISIGWRWVGKDKTHYADAWPFDDRKSRKAMLAEFHTALCEADAIVTYNGKSFDMPRINGEFVLFGLKPVAKRPHIDVYHTVRSLGLVSGKLEYALKHFGEGTKGKTGGFDLWRGFMDGDVKCRGRMRRYNKRDVRRTGALYLRLRPYMTNHPRLHDHPDCPECGSHDTKRDGYRRLEFYKVEKFQCQSCWHRYEGHRSKI